MKLRALRRAAPTLALAAAYLATGLVMVYGTGMIYGDALSRIADARIAIGGRDPHLGALGSIFGPLPALLAFPIVALRSLWPDLVTRGIAAIIVSSLAMAAAASQLVGIAVDRGWRLRNARITAAFFALHPFVVLYAANGMGEALFVAFSFRLIRMLFRWNHARGTDALTSAAGALGFMYLVRYEAAIIGAATVSVVAFVTWNSSRGATRRSRLQHLAMASTVIAFPLAAAVIGWSLYSWVLTGELFAQLTSLYGNRSILSLEGGRAVGLGTGLAHSASLAPSLIVLFPIAGILSWRRRDPDLLIATAALGPTLLFSIVSIAIGATFPFMRFTLVAVVIAMTTVVLLRRRVDANDIWQSRLPVRPRSTRSSLALATAAALVAAAFPTSLAAMNDPQLGTQDRAITAALLGNTGPRDRQTLRTFTTERQIAAFLDAELNDSDRILLDSMYGFAILAATAFPERFIVPSDRLFQRALENPDRHGVTHLLAVPREGRGLADALNRRFPTLYDTGADIGLLMMEIRNDGDQPDWRIFLVSPQESSNP
jgi:hypothetical protein